MFNKKKRIEELEKLVDVMDRKIEELENRSQIWTYETTSSGLTDNAVEYIGGGRWSVKASLGGKRTPINEIVTLILDHLGLEISSESAIPEKTRLIPKSSGGDGPEKT